jgi:hypothetical protein
VTAKPTLPKPRQTQRPRATKAQPTERIPRFRPDSAQDIADEELSAYLRRIDLGMEVWPGAPPANPEKPKS